MRRLLKPAALGAIAAASGRHPVLLPREARDERLIARVEAPYRVADGVLVMTVREPGPGRLRATFAPRGGAEWRSPPLDCDGTAVLTLDLATGAVTWRDAAVGSVSGGVAIAARRFDWHFVYDAHDGSRRSRTTSHYAVRLDRPVDAAYYRGEDYVDHELESAGVHEAIVEMVRRHGARGPMLEVGCATGGTIEALRRAGHEAYGVDLSDWAVAQAARRLGDGVAWRGDVEREPLPPPLAALAPFGAIVLASVLEHFRRPSAVLDDLSRLAGPGAHIFIITSNAASLTRAMFGTDWEGYFDWTHHGVDQVTPLSLRTALAASGWQVRELYTWHVWDGSADPTHACVRDWFAADARLRQLLAERELGDFITCVARKGGA